MRVIPKLTIDRILMLSVLLSCVYLLLYGTQMPPDDVQLRHAMMGKKPEIHPGKSLLPGVDLFDHTPSDAGDWDNLKQDVDHTGSHPSIQYNDLLGVKGHADPLTCPNHARVDFLRGKCRKSPATRYDYGQGDKQTIRYAVVDDERKLFYCLIGKAGSKSLLRYMVESKSSYTGGHLRHNDYLHTVGLRMLRSVPLEKAVKHYKDYYKFIVVRHPLQRTVSAFYETVKFHKSYRNEQGSLLNFTEYAQAITGDLMDQNPHWRRYINRCKVCKVDYQHILKLETLNEDMRSFNKAIGNRKGQHIDFIHQNRFLSDDENDAPAEIDHYKYDKTLHSLQKRDPRLMAKLINTYSDDMQLFGYKWDWTSGKSYCGAIHDGKECC